MSVEGAVDACARVAALATGIKRAYSSTGSGQAGVYPIPTDITDAPIALVGGHRFDLTKSGSPEVINHYVTVEVWVRATDPGVAEKEMLPLVTNLVIAFRTHVGLFGNAFTAKLTEGGPARDEDVAGQPFRVYPITVKCTEMTTPTYDVGPSS